MATKKQVLVGVLALIISLTSIYIILGTQVKIKVEASKSTFYVYENNSWIVSGIEQNRLYNGTRSVTRNITSIYAEIDNVTNSTKIVRGATYQNSYGNATIIDTYVFYGNTTDVSRFPISHTIEIINGKGLIFDYQISKLLYGKETQTLNGTGMSFGHNMKVEWDSGYYYARIFDTGLLKLRYKVPSNDVVYNIRLFDPVIVLYLNSSSVDRYYEYGYSINATGTADTGQVCLSISLVGYGTNFSCATGTKTQIFTAQANRDYFTDGNTSKNVTANNTVLYMDFGDPSVRLTNASWNISGYVGGTDQTEHFDCDPVESGCALATTMDFNSFRAQSFRSPYTSCIEAVTIKARYVSGTVGEINVSIRSNNGTQLGAYGVYPYPGSTVYGWGILPVFSNTSDNNYMVNMTVKPCLTAGTKYVIVMTPNSSTTGSYYLKGDLTDAGDPTKGYTYGCEARTEDGGTIWIAEPDYDFYFKLHQNQYPKDIQIDIGNDGIIDHTYPGELNSTSFIYNTLSNGNTSENMTFSKAGTIVRYFKISSNVSSASFNMTGYGGEWSLFDDTEDSFEYNCTSGGSMYEYFCNSPTYPYSKAMDEIWLNDSMWMVWDRTGSLNETYNYNKVDGANAVHYVQYYGRFLGQTGVVNGTYTIRFWNQKTNTFDLINTTSCTASTPCSNYFYINATAPNNVYVNASKNLITKTQLQAGFAYLGYVESEVRFNYTGCYDSWIRVGGGSANVWNWTGVFNQTSGMSGPNTTLLLSEINTYLSTCDKDAQGYCLIPIYTHSESPCKIMLQNISLASPINPVILNTTIFQNFINVNSTVPIKFMGTYGGFNINNISFPIYASQNITVKAHDPSMATVDTQYAYVVFSNFSVNLPNHIPYFEFLPNSNSSQNVTAYGQSNTTPIFVIESEAYDKAMNVSVYWNTTNQTFMNCLNITLSPDNVKGGSDYDIKNTTQTIATELGTIHGHDATLYNFEDGWTTSGQFGGALSFDGVDSLLNATNDTALNFANKNWSVTFWDKWNAIPSAESNIIGNMNQSVGWEISQGSTTGYLSVTCNSYSFSVSSFTQTVGQWYFYAITRNNTNVILYVNGAQNTSTAYACTITSTTYPVLVGKHNTRPFASINMVLDDIRLYNKTLSAAEVSNLYAGTSVTDQQILNWKLDEGGGSIAYDGNRVKNIWGFADLNNCPGRKIQVDLVWRACCSQCMSCW